VCHAIVELIKGDGLQCIRSFILTDDAIKATSILRNVAYNISIQHSDGTGTICKTYVETQAIKFADLYKSIPNLRQV
jgi:hypothetical protein